MHSCSEVFLKKTGWNPWKITGEIQHFSKIAGIEISLVPFHHFLLKFLLSEIKGIIFEELIFPEPLSAATSEY